MKAKSLFQLTYLFTWIRLADICYELLVEAGDEGPAHRHQVVLVCALDEQVEPADPRRLVHQVATLAALHAVRVVY